jgi:hypothetical protein
MEEREIFFYFVPETTRDNSINIKINNDSYFKTVHLKLSHLRIANVTTEGVFFLIII